MFADPWNPSITEIRTWAYDAEAKEPCQDWDLALSWAGYERDYLALVADQGCPKRAFFLQIIYLMIGDAVRTKFRVASEASVQGFLRLAEGHPDRAIRQWHERSLRLLKNHNEFNYEAWCAGGLARNDA